MFGGSSSFTFYANPYYLGLGQGFFEPRIYKQFPLERLLKSREAWIAASDAELAYDECTRLMDTVLKK